MLPNNIVRMLNIFDVIGFDTGSTKISKNRIFIHFIYLVQIVTAIFFAVFTFTALSEFNSSLRLLEVVNNMVQYSATLFTYWIIILETYVQHQAHKYFWEICKHMDEQFCIQLNQKFYSYIFKFVEFNLMTFLIFIIHSIISFSAMKISLAYLFLVKMCQLRVFYYLFCLEVVNFQLKMAHCEIKEMKRISTKVDFNLRRFRKIYYNIYEMTEYLNKIFGWSQAAAILFCFYFLSTDLCYLYDYFDKISAALSIGELIN